MDVNLSTQQDVFVWKLTTLGVFVVKNLYLHYMNDHLKFLNIFEKLKVPLKIRYFMWLHKKVLLTKDNLSKRNWQGLKSVFYCDQDETLQHLFISCPLARVVWRIVHMAFNISPPKSITNIFGN
jgi:hypothetical protein